MNMSKKSFVDIFDSVVKKTSGKCVLGFVDLNSMKMINDTYGHSAGDKIIEQVKVIMDDIFDVWSCFGGDEFAFLTAEGQSVAEAQIMALQSRLKTDPVIKSVIHYGITASIGATEYYQSKHWDFETTFKEVDKFMYEAKKLAPHFFRSSWADHIPERRLLETNGTNARAYFDWITTVLARQRADLDFKHILEATRIVFQGHENIIEYSPKILFSLIEKELDNLTDL